MGELRVRDVDDGVISELKARAKRHHRTLGEEVRTVLSEEVMRPRREFADGLRQFGRSLREKYGTMDDSASFIREMRDERG